MAPDVLPLVTQEILDECPRLRVLVVGKSGVGKSSLIRFAFGVDLDSISHVVRGECNINNEIISPQNPRFALHDSMGFEAGETQNYDTVQSFLVSRDKVELKDRVHVIWLCIQIPASGGRVFETGDERLLKLASDLKVPVIVVFTQYDKLYNARLLALRNKTPKDQLKSLCTQQANAEFERICVEPLHSLNPALRHARTSGLSGRPGAKPDRNLLDELVHLTREAVEASPVGEAWIVSTMAQRASVREKISGTIAVGMKRYWQGLGSTTNFSGLKLELCLAALHKEITDSWNFFDPEDRLQCSEFLEKIRKLAQLVTPEPSEVNSWFSNVNDMQIMIGIVASTTIAATVAPALATIGLSAWFIAFITGVYRQTPETLRCFMGYIVDLTLVLDQLFLITIARSSRPLTDEEINEAFENYKNAELGRVHRDIRLFANQATFAEIVQGDTVAEKMKALIWEYSDLNVANRA